MIVFSSSSPLTEFQLLHGVQWGRGTVPSLWVQSLKNKHVYIPVTHTRSFFFFFFFNKRFEQNYSYIKTRAHADTPQATNISNNRRCLSDCRKREMFFGVDA